MTGNVRSVNAATAMPIAAKVKKPPKPSSVNDVRSAASPRTIIAKILVATARITSSIPREANRGKNQITEYCQSKYRKEGHS